MDGNKTVEPGHTVGTGQDTNTESTTALDGIYQPGMAPLGAQPGGTGTPAGAEGGTGDGAGSEAVPNAPITETGTEGSGEGAESKYAGLSAADLRKLCKERGLKAATNISTANLIASLVEYDELNKYPVAAEDDECESEPVMIVLKKGGTYRCRGCVYKKGVPAPAAPELAEKLLRTGMFARG